MYDDDNMDNLSLSVTAKSRRNFDRAIEIAFSDHGLAKFYRISVTKGLILYWTKPDNKEALPLPFPLNVETAKDFCWSWLISAEYEPEPDHDGDNEKGYTVYNESWGAVDDEWQAFVAIKPTWAMLGK